MHCVGPGCRAAGRRSASGCGSGHGRGSGHGCGAGRPLEVGSRPADRSWAGALDLGGNVREWTASEYGAYPGAAAASHRHGRVNRGGSFAMNARELGRGYTRGVDRPTETQPDLGFRCAVDLPGAPPAPKRTP